MVLYICGKDFIVCSLWQNGEKIAKIIKRGKSREALVSFSIKHMEVLALLLHDIVRKIAMEFNFYLYSTQPI